MSPPHHLLPLTYFSRRTLVCVCVCEASSLPCCCCCRRFGELVARDPVAALSFLQTDISAIVNHDDPQESSEVSLQMAAYLFLSAVSLSLSVHQFRQLASSLFTTLPPAPPSPFTAAAEGKPHCVRGCADCLPFLSHVLGLSTLCKTRRNEVRTLCCCLDPVPFMLLSLFHSRCTRSCRRTFLRR